MDLKLKLKNKPLILYGRFKVISRNDDDLESLLSSVKRFSDDIGIQFGPDKWAKVTFKKGSLVKSKCINLNINTEITKLEYNKSYKYFGINK